MHDAYLETHFACPEIPHEWPTEFAIITAWNPTGCDWPVEQSEAADRQLEEELRQRGRWILRATGCSPSTGHAEPGWAVEMSWEEACDLGAEYKQDAIYFISDDDLFVSHCRGDRALVPVGSFRERLHAGEPPEPS